MPTRRHDERPSGTASAEKQPRAGDRIAKLLARAGIASRRDVERMIAEGRVALNGTAIDTPATVLASLAGITVDGNPVAAPAPARLFLYHKPVGLLVTERDPRGRPTIYDRLPADLPRVVPVGRLDLATEGLLLLTTDGGFKRQLELPATGVERAYRARAYGNVTQAQLEDLMDGIEIEGVRYGSIDANIERRTGANVWIEMTLAEGKNREVRRVLEHLGLQVSRLIRTRYGPFVLGDLPVSEVGEVRQHDLVAFRRTLKGGSPDEPIGLPVADAPRAGFRTPPSTDRGQRSRRPAAPERSAPAARVDAARPARPPRPAGHAAPTDTSRRRDAATSERPRAGFGQERPPRTAKPGAPKPNGAGEQRDDRRSARPARHTRSAVGTETPRRSDHGASEGPRPGGKTDRERKPTAGPRAGSGQERRSHATKPGAAKPNGTRPQRADDDRAARPVRPARPSRGGAPSAHTAEPSRRPTKPGGPRGPRRPNR